MKQLEQHTVIYCEPPDETWQFFLCMAEDGEHAEEQCQNAYPECVVLWVNEGENYIMDSMEDTCPHCEDMDGIVFCSLEAQALYDEYCASITAHRDLEELTATEADQ